MLIKLTTRLLKITVAKGNYLEPISFCKESGKPIYPTRKPLDN